MIEIGWTLIVLLFCRDVLLSMVFVISYQFPIYRIQLPHFLVSNILTWAGHAWPRRVCSSRPRGCRPRGGTPAQSWRCSGGRGCQPGQHRSVERTLLTRATHLFTLFVAEAHLLLVARIVCVLIGLTKYLIKKCHHCWRMSPVGCIVPHHSSHWGHISAARPWSSHWFHCSYTQHILLQI